MAPGPRFDRWRVDGPVEEGEADLRTMAGTDAADERAERPFVSVVVPVYNDPDGLAQTLESLTVQTYPADRHEVIVVDNGSTDDTPAVAHGFCSRHDHVTLVVEGAIQGSYAARNRGIRNASGEVIAFVDADVTVPADWLARVAAATAETDYLACGVQLYTDGTETLASKYDRLSGFRVGWYVDELHFAPTCCLAVRAGVFDDVGLFDSRLVSSGDLEFGNRVHESGRTLTYRPDIRMYHPTRDSVAALLRKAARIGRGRQQLRRFYPDRYGSPLLGLVNPGTYLPPPPWAVGDRFRGWEGLSPLEKLVFYALVTLTGLARTAGAFREAVAEAVRRAPPGDYAGVEERETAE